MRQPELLRMRVEWLWQNSSGGDRLEGGSAEHDGCKTADIGQRLRVSNRNVGGMLWLY